MADVASDVAWSTFLSVWQLDLAHTAQHEVAEVHLLQLVAADMPTASRLNDAVRLEDSLVRLRVVHGDVVKPYPPSAQHVGGEHWGKTTSLDTAIAYEYRRRRGPHAGHVKSSVVQPNHAAGLRAQGAITPA